MNLTPEEKFNKDIWYVLQKIKERALYSKQSSSIVSYRVIDANFIGGEIFYDNEIETLEKIQEMEAVKNLKETEEYNVFSLEIIQPKFDEIYKKYRELASKKPKQDAPANSEKIDEQAVEELNLNGYSEDNLRRFSNIIKVISNQIELDSWNRLTNIVKIPLAALEREGFSYEEMRSILGSINKINNKKVVSILNERPYKEMQKRPTYLFDDDTTGRAGEINKKEALRKWLNSEGRFMDVSEGDLMNNLILQLSVKIGQDPLQFLGGYKKSVDSKLNEVVITRGKKVAKQSQGIRGEDKKIRKNKFKKSEGIRKITIIKMNNGKHLFAINDDYENVKRILEHSEWWQIFIGRVAEQSMLPEARTNVKTIPKKMADYFNYNKKCPIYMGGKYALTDIFVGRDIDTMINSDIKTATMTERQYVIRKKKAGRK